MDSWTPFINIAPAFLGLFLLMRVLVFGSSVVIAVTEPLVHLEKGSPGSLPCVDHVDGYVYTVTWMKGDTWATAENVVVMDTNAHKGATYGPGFDSGSYDIHEDFSLLIREVGFENQGRYFCVVIPRRPGGTFAGDHTDVEVYARPLAPYPILTVNASYLNENEEQACGNDVDDMMNVTCTVTGYYPDIALYFRDGETSSVIPALENHEVDNEDGTKTRTISFWPSLVAGENTYQCVAANIPGLPKVRKVAKKTLVGNRPWISYDNVKVAVVVIICAMLLRGLANSENVRRSKTRCLLVLHSFRFRTETEEDVRLDVVSLDSKPVFAQLSVRPTGSPNLRARARPHPRAIAI